MNNQSYFYQFLEPVSKELAGFARELESSVFSSPRSMLSHARNFIENILIRVMQEEGISSEPRMGIKDRIDILYEEAILVAEVRNALHHIRMIGNEATHNIRVFRYSEALLSWEAMHIVVKWYVEVYGPASLEVPAYKEPTKKVEEDDGEELEHRLHILEEMLKKALERDKKELEKEAELVIEDPINLGQPGFTPIRTITYKNESIEIPYFLRDAFLLPQRFELSERFLIRLGGEQQARIMSELPENLEGLHKFVTRYNETNDENFFNELKVYLEEEKSRRKLKEERPGELFFFFKAKHLIVTESLSSLLITTEEFTGFPSFIRQLNEQGYHTVGQLPSELVTLAKYKGVGIKTLKDFFRQLEEKQRWVNV